MATVTLTPEEMAAKAAELRASAAADSAAREESFERCDTDGFLSQWAHGINSSLKLEQARILEAGGKDEFPALFLPTGERVKAKVIDSQYGRCWAIVAANGRYSRFVSLAPYWEEITDDMTDEMKANVKKNNKRRERWEKKHGFKQGVEMAPAIGRLEGRGRGLSGTCFVVVERTDDGYPPNAVVVS